MTDLSPGTRDLLTAGVRALEPSLAARDRIRAGVAARIAVLPGSGGAGESGQGGASAAGTTSSAAGTILKTSLLAVIGAVVVGAGAMWFAGGDDAPATPPAATSVVAAPAAPDESAPEPAPAETAPAAVEDDPTPARRVAAHGRRKADRRHEPIPRRSEPADTTADELAREVRLLDSARRALSDGDPDGARDALGRYRREIAAPQMERESLLLRAEAQCAAAETDAGLRTLADVDRRWPGASGVDAVRAQCREAAR